MQYYWADGNYIGNLNPRIANPYVHVSSNIRSSIALTRPLVSRAALHCTLYLLARTCSTMIELQWHTEAPCFAQARRGLCVVPSAADWFKHARRGALGRQ